MTGRLDHLWQSSLFALMMGLLTLALRNNQARILSGFGSPPR